MMHSGIQTDRNGSLWFKLSKPLEMDAESFKNTPIYHTLTPMTCEDMLVYMDTHPDLFVAADMKNDITLSYSYLVDLAKSLGLESVLDRIIISIYNYEDYAKIMAIYPFKEKAIRQYCYHPHNYYELLDFCLQNNIQSVNISNCYVDDEGVQMLISKGLRVYVAVVDDYTTFEQYRKKGIYGCVSNNLYEDQFKR